MLEQLKFVQGAVAKKDLLPALTHFQIENGTVRSFNGTLALCSPISLDIDCVPKAVPFYKAIQNCKDDTVTLTMTKANRLSIKSGNFKAFIDCVDEATPHVEPEGDSFEIDGKAMLAAMEALYPFMGDDASRPWSNGVLLNGQSAFATNNVILTQYWVGSVFPILCTIPRDAVREMLRIGEAPTLGQATENSITFHYEEGRWLRTALLSNQWPDVEAILNVENATPAPLHAELFDALDVVKPFSDQLGRVYFLNNGIATSTEEGQGACVELGEFPFEGVYQIEMLSKLKGVVEVIDLNQYPGPCPFYGGKMRGVIIGMRL